MLVNLLIAATLAFAPILANADDESLDWMEYYQKGDYESTAKIFKKGAIRGDKVFQLFLGELYLLGKGVPKNIDTAHGLFIASATQGEIRALEKLTSFYLEGYGVSKNLVLALTYNLIETRMFEQDDMFQKWQPELKPRLIKQYEFISGKLSQMQIEEALRLSSKWEVGTPLPYRTTTWTPKQKIR